MNKTDTFLPENMRQAMEYYLEHGIEPGGFLYAALTNNLKESIARADQTNLEYLTNIVSYFYNNIPALAWGSVAKVEAWMQARKEDRILKATREGVE
jgi:hypothetical protein